MTQLEKELLECLEICAEYIEAQFKDKADEEPLFLSYVRTTLSKAHTIKKTGA